MELKKAPGISYHNQTPKAVYQIEDYSKGQNEGLVVSSDKINTQNTLYKSSTLLKIILLHKNGHGGN